MKKDIVKYKDPDTGKNVMAEVLMRFENGDVRTDRDGMKTRNEVTSIYETIKDTSHYAGYYTAPITVPKGTEVYPANNLPDGGYWVNIHHVSNIHDHEHYDEIESWARNYGFWVSEAEVDIALPF